MNDWTQYPTHELYERWLDQFPTEEDAIAEAIFLANRHVKTKAAETKRKFYSIKERWIERHQDQLVDGRIVQEEKLKCRTCDGKGKVQPGPCYRCDCTGTGPNGKVCRNCAGE